MTEFSSPTSRKKAKVRNQNKVLDSLLHKQSSRNRPAELNLSRKASNDFIQSLNIGYHQKMGATTTRNHDLDPSHLIATTGSTLTN